METWKPIPEFLGYEVSDIGNVRTFLKNCGRKGHVYTPSSIPKILKTYKKRGYPCVCLFRNKKRRYIGVHRLIAFAFMGGVPDGMFVCHNDGNRANSILENLRIDTPKGNLSDRERHGTFTQRGETNPKAKLTASDVIAIRNEYKKGVIGYGVFAKRYGVDRITIKQVVQYLTWKHIAKESVIYA